MYSSFFIDVAVGFRVFLEFSSFFSLRGHIPVEAPPPPVRRGWARGFDADERDDDDGHGGHDGHDGGGDGAVVPHSQEVHDQPEEDFETVEVEDSESVTAILEEADAAIESLNREIEACDNYEELDEWTAEEWKEWEAANGVRGGNGVPVSERPVARPLAADFPLFSGVEMEAAEEVEILSDEEAEEAPKREEGSVANEEQVIREELQRMQQMLDEHLD